MKERQQSSGTSKRSQRKGYTQKWAVAIAVYLCFALAVCLTLMPSSKYWDASTARHLNEVSPSPKQVERALKTSPISPEDVLFLDRNSNNAPTRDVQ